MRISCKYRGFSGYANSSYANCIYATTFWFYMCNFLLMRVFPRTKMRISRGTPVMLDWTNFVGSEFGIFGGFGWVCSSVLVDEPGFGRVRSLVFPDLGLGSTYFRAKKFEVRTFWRVRKGSKFGFGRRTWIWKSSKFDMLGSKQFEVRLIWVHSNTIDN